MKLTFYALAILVCFSSCAQNSVAIYDRNGHLAARAYIQGDVTNFTMTTPNGSVHVDALNNSAATTAGSKLIGATTSYLGGLATILRLILPFFP